MKKIGIISIHYGVNFGSSLQAVALFKYLKEKLCDSEIEIINYIPPRFTFKVRFFSVFKGGLKTIAHRLIRFLRFESNNNKYRKYLKKNVIVSPEIYSLDDLRDRYSDFDYLIAGSDQIWNSDYNQGIDPAYYLRFASSGTKKIAYAASCGKESFSDKEWELIRTYLADFKAISLREMSAKSMMNDAGIDNCQFVLDPTFLLSRDEWGKYEKEVKDCPKNFLLIYFLDVEGKEIIQLANRIAQERHLKTVLIINGQSRKVLNSYEVDYIARNLTPDSYIWLFRHASFVVTNSFHGVSFSINMERQFVALKREKYNSRLDSILSTMGLLDRYTEIDDYSNKQDINYQEVNKTKIRLLHDSKEFIIKSLDIV